MYKGVNHLALATGDLDATIRFWRDLLEMPMVVSMGHHGRKQYFFSAGSAMVTFFEWEGVEPGPDKDHGAPVKGPFTFYHISFELEDAEALWLLKDRLEAADVWVSEEVDHGFIHSIYSFDPNNIPIEFSYTLPGCDVRRTPRLADRDATAIAAEGAQPQKVWPAVVERTPMEDRIAYPGDGMSLFEEQPCGAEENHK